MQMEEYVPENAYEANIIKTLQDLSVKDTWKKRVYENGSFYFGDIHADKRNGKGIYVFASQDFYYGTWINNVMEGYGSYIFKSG